MDVPFQALKYVLTPENRDPQKPRYEPYGVLIRVDQLAPRKRMEMQGIIQIAGGYPRCPGEEYRTRGGTDGADTE